MDELVSFKTDVVRSTMNASSYNIFNSYIFSCKTHLSIQHFEISTPWMSVVNFKQRSGYTSLLFTKCIGSLLSRKKKSQILVLLSQIRPLFLPYFLREFVWQSYCVLDLLPSPGTPTPYNRLCLCSPEFLGLDALLCVLIFQDMDEVKLNPWPDVHIKIKPSFKPWMHCFSHSSY